MLSRLRDGELALTPARTSVLLIVPCIAVYGISVWWYGRRLDSETMARVAASK